MTALFSSAESVIADLVARIAALENTVNAMRFNFEARFTVVETRLAMLEAGQPPVPPDEPTDPDDGDTGVPPSGAYVLLPQDELMALPTSGAAWNAIQTWAAKPVAAPNLSDQDDRNRIVAFAKALEFARTGSTARRAEVVRMLQAARRTEEKGDTLGIARGVLPLVLAADLIDFREDADWYIWFAGLRTWKNPDRGYSLISMHEKRPNNWGTHAGAGRIAMDLFLGDTGDLEKAIAVFKGYLGDRSSYADFKYGDDLSWHADPAKPVGVNPKGASKDGMSLDGILPDDARRGGGFPKLGSDGVMYTYEALQGIILQAELLHRHGYPAYEWSDQAVLRAYARISQEQPAKGDDTWQPWIINKRYGTSYPAASPTTPGKAFGFADWIFT